LRPTARKLDFCNKFEKLFQMFFQFAFSCCKNIVTIATFENERINELRFSEARLFNFFASFAAEHMGKKESSIAER